MIGISETFSSLPGIRYRYPEIPEFPPGDFQIY
jgi:hypothetical protein